MLKIENASYHYKNSDRYVLCNISADFEAGRLYAIVGPSGSGKTTLLSLMAGLDMPTAGTVTIDGEDLTTLDLDEYRRERVAMIFQAFNLFPLFTAIENVCVPMELKGEVAKKARQAQAKKLLTSVGIEETMYKRYPSNLSGGEQQRVAIARALSSGAKIILADEPTGNLDAVNSRAVTAILKKLAREDGYCVIAVTHNLEIAEASDVVMSLSDGSLSEIKINKNSDEFQIAVQQHGANRTKHEIKWQNEKHVIDMRDICYVEAYQRHLFFNDGERNIESVGKMSDIEAKFMTQNFVRCHRNFLVNMSCIKSIEKTEILLNNEEKISLSRRMKPDVIDAFNNFLSQQG
jgi:putative ABC transport system ATP-binding protein